LRQENISLPGVRLEAPRPKIREGSRAIAMRFAVFMEAIVPGRWGQDGGWV